MAAGNCEESVVEGGGNVVKDTAGKEVGSVVAAICDEESVVVVVESAVSKNVRSIEVSVPVIASHQSTSSKESDSFESITQSASITPGTQLSTSFKVSDSQQSTSECADVSVFWQQSTSKCANVCVFGQHYWQ